MGYNFMNKILIFRPDAYLQLLDGKIEKIIKMKLKLDSAYASIKILSWFSLKYFDPLPEILARLF